MLSSVLKNVFSSQKTNVTCATINSTLLAINLLRLYLHLNTKRKIDNSIVAINGAIDTYNKEIKHQRHCSSVSNITIAYNNITDHIHKNNVKFYSFMALQTLGCIGSTIISYYCNTIDKPSFKLAATILNVISTTCLTLAMIPTRTLLQNNFEVYSQDHGRMMLYSYDTPLPIFPDHKFKNEVLYYDHNNKHTNVRPFGLNGGNNPDQSITIYEHASDSNKICFVYQSNEYSIDKLHHIFQNYTTNAKAVQSNGR